MDKVQCVVFRKNLNFYEFLILKRTMSKGGYWQSVTGHVEPEDATLLHAAWRELMEETGLGKNDVIGVYERVHHFDFTVVDRLGNAVRAYTETCFAFETTKYVTIDLAQPEHEHEKFLWLPLKKSLPLLKWESNRVALQKTHDLLMKKQ